MELLLVKLVALARPLASMEFGGSLFIVAGIGLFGVLIVGLLIHMAVAGSLRISGIDFIIFAFVIWCIVVSLIYFESVRIGEVAKLLIPLLSYTVVKNVVRDGTDYRRMVAWIIAGFAIPALLSAALIVTKSQIAIDMVNYWTGVARWDGVYIHSHNLGHSMTLFLMALVIWWTLSRRAHDGEAARVSRFSIFLVGVLGMVALFCLYMSQVRSALLGLLTFAFVYLFYFNRRLLLFSTAGLAGLAVVSSPYWLPGFAPELFVEKHGIEVTALDVGSGRPRFWLNDIAVYARLPLDQQIGGVGIGASEGVGDGEVLYGHNDWLGMLTQTGIVGLLLFIALQVAILRRLLRMEGKERYVFLALFLAINLMMLVSNSYVWRIQVSQLYYMLLAFIEIPNPRTRPEPVAAFQRAIA